MLLLLYRNLSSTGTVTEIKLLALPMLIKILSVLPDPPPQYVKELQCAIFKFLWNEKPDKIKRKVTIHIDIFLFGFLLNNVYVGIINLCLILLNTTILLNENTTIYNIIEIYSIY